MARDDRPLLFGEVLFDRFPDGSAVLGGAPFNVTWHLRAFGLDPLLVTRVGDDDLGARVREACDRWELDDTGLQVDPDVATSTSEITFEDGEPSYDIVLDRAFDRIDAAALPDVDAAPLLYHGSLALRAAPSRAAYDTLRARVDAPRFVDVNLRAPWWTRDVVVDLCSGARWVKLNADEWDVLAADETDDVPAVLTRLAIEQVVITRGEQGADLVTRDHRAHVAPGPDVEVVDTVGAGDAFTSVLLLGLLSDWPTDVTLRRAQDFASRIVGVRGATVDDRAFYDTVVDEWHAETPR